MHGGPGLELHVLSKQTEPHSACANDVAAIRRLLTADQPKYCGLAGPVATNEADVLAGIYLKRRSTEDILSAVRFVNV